MRRSCPASSLAIVLLPEPLSPTSATHRAPAEPERDVLDGGDGCGPAPVPDPVVLARMTASSTSGPRSAASSGPTGGTVASAGALTVSAVTNGHALRCSRASPPLPAPVPAPSPLALPVPGPQRRRPARGAMSISCTPLGRPAARHERAARERAAQVGRRAGDPSQPATRARAAGGTSRAARACRGARRRRGSASAGADSTNLAGVHDHDPVGDLEQQREVVGDEQDREAEALLELEDLAQDLALDDDVERRSSARP